MRETFWDKRNGMCGALLLLLTSQLLLQLAEAAPQVSQMPQATNILPNHFNPLSAGITAGTHHIGPRSSRRAISLASDPQAGRMG